MNRKYLSVLLFALLLTLLVVTTVSAAVGWGTISEQTWLNPGYDISVGVTSLSVPHRYICITYTVDTNPAQTNRCTCTSPDCAANIGTWHCQIPANHIDAAISWSISGWANANCSGNQIAGPSGVFNTGPNAIELSSFEVDNERNGLSSYVLVLAILLILLGSAVALSWRYRSRMSRAR